jgi:hypothetical protein
LITVSAISTILLFGILLVKVYGVAHFNINIAAALISASPSSVVLGIIAIYSYFFLAMIATTSGLMLILTFNHDGLRYKNYRPLLLLIALFFSMLTPWQYLIDGIVLTSVLTVLLFAVCRWIAPFSWTKAFMASIVVIFMLLILATLDQPWLPSELITLKHPVVTDKTVKGGSMSQRPVAFVLGEESNRLEILVDESRNVIFVSEDIIVSRQICNLNTNPMGSNPIIQLFIGGKFEGHVLSCWRETDQPTEERKKKASVIIRWLEWERAYRITFNFLHYLHYGRW